MCGGENWLPIVLVLSVKKKTHSHTHTCWFCYTCGDSHRRNGFCTVQTVYSIALHQPYT